LQALAAQASSHALFLPRLQLRAPLRQTAEHALTHVLRVGGVAGEAVGEAVYVVPIPGEQFGELGAGHSVTSFVVI
jgi:hypothetical protein